MLVNHGRTLVACLLSVVMIWAFAGLAAAKPSFDCRKASQTDEKKICQYAELAEFDQQIHDLYFGLRDGMSAADQARLLEAQRAYLRKRKSCASSRSCLRKRMSARLGELQQMASVSPGGAAAVQELDVRRLQQLLNENGFDVGTADGIAGPRTTRAAALYLRGARLPVVAGRELQDAFAALTGQAGQGGASGPREVIVAAAPEGAPTDIDTPLSLQNIGGTWRFARLALVGDIYTAEMRYFLLKDPVEIRVGGDSSVSVVFEDGTSPVRYRDEGEEGLAFLLRPERGRSETKLAFSRIRPKSYRSGVDILTNEDRGLLIRFRKTPGAVALGIADLDLDGFCRGPAARLAEGAADELQAIERVRRQRPDAAPEFRQAVALGVLGGPEFSSVFGTVFLELDNGVRTEIVERLRACALYHPNRNVGDVLVAALWGEDYSLKAHAADGFVAQRGKYRGRGPIYNVRTSPGAVATLLREADAARTVLAEAETDMSAAGDDLDALEEIAIRLERAAKKLPASEAGSALLRARQVQQFVDEARKAAVLAEQDATLPPQPERVLIRDAARGFFLRDCSRGRLLLQSALNDGVGAGLVLAAGKIGPKLGRCELNMGTHLLSFNVSSVPASSCAEGDPATCTFVARFECKLALNPEFGFDSRTANIDPFCPVINALEFDMQGTFERNAPSRWTAIFLD